MVLCTQRLCTDKKELCKWIPFHPICNAKSATKNATKLLFAQKNSQQSPIIVGYQKNPQWALRPTGYFFGGIVGCHGREDHILD